MPRLNFAEPVMPMHLERAIERTPAFNAEDIVRLAALGMTTLEVAHDLGNLLQITGSAVRMIDRNLSGTPRAALSPIIGAALTSIERATTLSRRMLDTARPRPTAGGKVYLDTVLSEMRDRIALAAGPAVQVQIDLGDYIPAIACHQPDLENVILNLVANARDAMSAGGFLTLAVRRDPGGSDVLIERPDVLFSVADTGSGMAEAVAAQAFKPFFTTKPGDRGTGLGLALVGAFAGRQGGVAEIASAVGKGTTVMLRLPSCGG